MNDNSGTNSDGALAETPLSDIDKTFCTNDDQEKHPRQPISAHRESKTWSNETWYIEACRYYDQRPLKQVLTRINLHKLSLQYVTLGSAEARPIAECLKTNTSVKSIDISNNHIGSEGTLCFADIFFYNPFITELNLSSNSIGHEGIQAISNVLSENANLFELHLADNGLTDTDAKELCKGLKQNYCLKYLNVAKNKIGSDGGMCVAGLLASNNTLEKLNLSWNHIRGDGAVALGKCLVINTGLTKLDLSWNGLGFGGAVALKKGISANEDLQELNIKSNRINWEGATLISQGLAQNRTLKCLKIGLNPLTTTGITTILDVLHNENSAVTFLDLEGVPVSVRVLNSIQLISKIRPFRCIHDQSVSSDDILGKEIAKKVTKDDPIKLLVDFLVENAFRVVDLYRMLDKEGTSSVSREIFVQNLKKFNVPLTNKEFKQVVQRIDPKHTDKINYSMLIKGLQAYKVQYREDTKKKKKIKQKKRDIKEKLLAEVLFESSENDNISLYGNTNRNNAESTFSVSPTSQRDYTIGSGTIRSINSPLSMPPITMVGKMMSDEAKSNFSRSSSSLYYKQERSNLSISEKEKDDFILPLLT